MGAAASDDGTITGLATPGELGGLESNQDYVNVVNRIKSMNHPTRSGDIVLIMKDATTGNAMDRYSTGYACKSWHGSLNKSDSFVPLVVAYPSGNRFELNNSINSVCTNNSCEGNWKASDLIKKIVETQY